MKFKVYEVATNKDVTDEQEWYIDSDGQLMFMTNDIDSPLQEAGPQYRYEQILDDYIVLYPEDFAGDVWEDYCSICGESADALSLTIRFNSRNTEAEYSDDDDEEYEEDDDEDDECDVEDD